MRNKENHLIRGSLAGCGLLLLGRFALWGEVATGEAQNVSYEQAFPIYFLFLGWNIFLAWLPYLISRQLCRMRPGKWGVPILILLLWLLFYPNAPYLVTDLIHLRPRPPFPVWYDLLVLFSFACTGLILGGYSLLHVERYLAGFAPKTVRIFPFLILFLGSVGVYLGRFLRWNSWEVFTEPLYLIADFWGHTQEPGFLQQFLIIVLPLSFIQWIFYWLLKVEAPSTS